MIEDEWMTTWRQRYVVGMSMAAPQGLQPDDPRFVEHAVHRYHHDALFHAKAKLILDTAVRADVIDHEERRRFFRMTVYAVATAEWLAEYGPQGVRNQPTIYREPFASGTAGVPSDAHVRTATKEHRWV